MGAPQARSFDSGRGDVLIHPAAGTYSRIPVEPTKSGFLSIKVVEIEAETGPYKGTRIFLGFIDPQTRRDDPSGE